MSDVGKAGCGYIKDRLILFPRTLFHRTTDPIQLFSKTFSHQPELPPTNTKTKHHEGSTSSQRYPCRRPSLQYHCVRWETSPWLGICRTNWTPVSYFHYFSNIFTSQIRDRWLHHRPEPRPCPRVCKLLLPPNPHFHPLPIIMNSSHVLRLV